MLENVCSRWRLKMEWFARPGGPHRLTIVDGGAAGGRTQNYNKNKRFFILYFSFPYKKPSVNGDDLVDVTTSNPQHLTGATLTIYFELHKSTGKYLLKDDCITLQ